MFHMTAPAKLAAIVDWEMGTIGIRRSTSPGCPAAGRRHLGARAEDDPELKSFGTTVAQAKKDGAMTSSAGMGAPSLW